jgi:hypothetical protein
LSVHTDLFDYLTNYSPLPVDPLDYGLSDDGVVTWTWEGSSIPHSLARHAVENLGMTALQLYTDDIATARPPGTPPWRGISCYSEIHGYQGNWVGIWTATQRNDVDSKSPSRAYMILKSLQARHNHLWPGLKVQELP